MATPSQKIGIAVSGGADSVALLHVLVRLAPDLGLESRILHFNHQLRGPESDQDEEFVRQLGQSLQIPVEVKRGAPGQGNIEEAARDDRRAFFLGSGLDRIALGHTKSDQAETVLFRFLRGSGTAGLAGMRPVTPEGFIRPLLTISRDEVRDWLKTEGLAWREDSSNTDLRFTRNRLRLETIPALKRDFNPNLENVLAGMAEIAQAEENFWNSRISTVYSGIAKRTSDSLLIEVDHLERLHVAQARRIIRQAVTEVKGNLHSIDAAHIDAILQICHSEHGHDRVIIPGVDSLRSFKTLRLTRPVRSSLEERHYRLDITLGETADLPYSLGTISLKRLENCVKFKEEQELASEVADFDADALTGGELPRPLYVRNWEPGDRIRRIGHDSPEKLKALFQEYKVLLWERRHWPVLVSGNEIVWVRGFGCAAEFAVSPKSSRVIRLVYTHSV